MLRWPRENNATAPVTARLGDIKTCFGHGLRDDPTLDGQVEVKVLVGRKSRVEIARSNLGNETVEGCIVDAIGRHKVPLASVQLSVVNQAFTLMPPL